MKTPHRITLIRGEVAPRYNPETNGYDEIKGNETVVPCLVNFISQARVLKEYGNQTDVIMICRFQQAQEPFRSAIYDGSKYVPMDQIDVPIKGAVRMKKVGG
ncbi:hypothetical protein HO639_00965 [Streptococcus suis]|uniref:Phage protein n=1 Tax=Streptococcus suis TaxID=1307 RepID=A0A0Z8CJN1_STRSU|nr:hypothetical protein [Streptococcus suis]QBX21429.1 hypothetical protein Javan573_0042 [Streptococcus phage Javan573]NQH67476.1 hypothetical protein [Streptococcus suis]NQI05483.1 hypothetical protein [Streptococcus suis]CYU01785.1 Uncharacterised protein [Streptococcus suis]CYU26480.1 Uncharacterised protein [Streptococcus suis]